MSLLAKVFGRVGKAQECAVCGAIVVEGLRAQVDNWYVESKDDQGRSYGGYCTKCRKYYCWRCACTHGDILLTELNQPVVPTRATFDSAPVLDHHGLMYCPLCGDLGMPRTLHAT